MRTPGAKIHLSTLHDPGVQAATWKHIVRHDNLLAKHVRVNQRTMRLAGIIPSWESFMQTPYFMDMVKVLDEGELAKYRAWWELIYDCSEGKDLERPTALYILACLVREQLRRVYAKEMVVEPRKYFLTEEKGEQLKEAVLSRYSDLTR